MDYLWKDHYYKKAKEEGYRSRAAFKLIEINNKYRLLKSGKKVLDLGCAPGSWLQIACNSVGDKGFVFGVDKVKFNFPPRKNLLVLASDMEDEKERDKVEKTIAGKVDVVLSDISPKLTGIADFDNAMIFSLADISFDMCAKLLKKGGDFLIKLFQSNELNSFRDSLKTRFEKVNMIVPKATRRASSEIYILARGFKA